MLWRNIQSTWQGLKNLASVFADPQALHILQDIRANRAIVENHYQKLVELDTRIRLLTEQVGRLEETAVPLNAVTALRQATDKLTATLGTTRGALETLLADIHQSPGPTQAVADRSLLKDAIDAGAKSAVGRIEQLLEREVGTLKALAFRGILLPADCLKPYRIETDHPVALNSPDHVVPWGTMRDNSILHGFNVKLYELLGRLDRLTILDLGCAGGGFVQSLIEDGHDAVGLDGSDFSAIRRRAAWRSIPQRLFTCDITKPFTLRRDDGTSARFDIITAWEVMEHIQESDLPRLFDNLQRHLAPGGLFICSVCTVPDVDPVTKVEWHQTVRPREWWIDQLVRAELHPVEQDIIGKGDWLRGSGHFGEWEEGDGRGFHLVLRKGQDEAAGRQVVP